MSDTFLVLARFPCDDIPLQVCDNLHDAKTLAVTVANQTALILRDMAQSWKILHNSEPDIDALAAVVVLRLLEGAVPIEMVAKAIPKDE